MAGIQGHATGDVPQCGEGWSSAVSMGAGFAKLVREHYAGYELECKRGHRFPMGHPLLYLDGLGGKCPECGTWKHSVVAQSEHQPPA